MSHVVTRPVEPFLACGGRLEVHQVPAATDNLVWLAVCTATGEAAIVDGPDAEAVLAYAEARGIRITTVWNTHTHYDHIGVNRDLLARGVSVRIYGPARDAAAVPGLTDPVDEGDEVRVGAISGRVMLTEGHIDGHISFVLGEDEPDPVLFCGDTLFAGGCGYLFSGPPPKMFRSLMRLAELPGSTRVCCAHEYTQDNLRFAWSVEPDNEALADRIRRVWAIRAEGGCAVPSTIEEERATNPFLRPGSPTIRRSVGLEQGAFEQVFAATRATKDRKVYRERGDEGLPLD